MNKQRKEYIVQLIERQIRAILKEGHKYTLSYQDHISLITAECYYCGRLPYLMALPSIAGRCKDAIKTNGIDRKNNGLGYEPGNCVTACRVCNRMKRDASYQEFIARCWDIVARHPLTT